MNRVLMLFLLLGIFGVIGYANDSNSVLDHNAWDELLQKYVDDSGNVDYKAWSKDKSSLESYLSALENHPDFGSESREYKLAFWINAYNAYTVKLILDHYPLKSITELGNGKIWDKKWIKLQSKELSLNDIENSIIRPQFEEPRIHFAVNCAAKSCPPLYNRAFTASSLESQLEERTISFVNNPKYTQVSGSSYNISMIFKWYSADFPNLKSFLAKYHKSQKTAKNINYNEYDWKLNSK